METRRMSTSTRYAPLDVDETAAEALVNAFNKTVEEFTNFYGEAPKLDRCGFRGGFLTFDVVFEIIEEV